jgi:hypothetical protein
MPKPIEKLLALGSISNGGGNSFLAKFSPRNKSGLCDPHCKMSRKYLDLLQE